MKRATKREAATEGRGEGRYTCVCACQEMAQQTNKDDYFSRALGKNGKKTYAYQNVISSLYFFVFSFI